MKCKYKFKIFLSVFFINYSQTGERDQWKEKYVKGIGMNLTFIEGSEI